MDSQKSTEMMFPASRITVYLQTDGTTTRARGHANPSDLYHRASHSYMRAIVVDSSDSMHYRGVQAQLQTFARTVTS